jgi:hypothetical protein
MDEDRIETIVQNILKAIDPDQGDNVEVIFEALQKAITRQLSFVACPHCREKIAETFRADMPAMLKIANELAAQQEQEFSGDHTKH